MNIKKSLLWFYMFFKRLLHKTSFVVLICTIPLVVYVANISMQGESGVLRIILCSQKTNAGAEDIIGNIMARESIMLFEKSHSIEDALNALEQKKADAVWYFEDDLDQRIESYAKGQTTKPFIKVYEREDSIPLKLSREKLFGSVYGKLSYHMFKDFVYTDLVSYEDVSEERVKRYYDHMDRGSDLVEIKKIDVKEKTDKTTRNFLVTPLRGMLAVLVMLCSFAAAMYFISDKQHGKLDWLEPGKRIIPAFAQCLSATVIAAVAVLAAIFVSGIAVSVASEILSMMLFAISVSGFCLVLCIVFRSPGRLGAIIPALVVILMVLSPIFFNVQFLRPIRLMLPTHYYLYSLYDKEYYVYFVLYIVCVYSVCLGLNFILKGIQNKKSYLF